MNKKIITAILFAVSGIAFYILRKSLKEKRKRSLQRRDEVRVIPNSAYAYEYTL
jgi:hypothetical protein